MSKTQSPFSRESHPEKTFTIQIDKKLAWSILAVLVVLATLLVLDLRARQRQVEADRKDAAQRLLQANSSPVVAYSAGGVAEGDQRTKVETTPLNEPTPQAGHPTPPDDDQSGWGAEPVPVKLHDSDENLSPVSSEENAEPLSRDVAVSERSDAVVTTPGQPDNRAPDNSTDEPPTPSSPDSGQPAADPPADNGLASLHGAGATFPNPIYQKWFAQFHRLHPDIEIQYQSVGSGGGIRALQSGAVDFAGTDSPLTDQQLAQMTSKVLHIPTVLGAVVPIYNVPGLQAEIRFTPEALAGIFLGKIRVWNDPALTSANPGLLLPNRVIEVIHRSDPGPTTYVFTDFLSKASRDWRNTVATGDTVNWPCGEGARGNEGVSEFVRRAVGAIGYVELIYALQNRIQYGSVKNPAEQFVKASPESVTAAAASVRDMPPDFRVSITNAPGADAYPISSYTWLLVPRQLSDPVKSKDLVAFLRWMLDRGQRSASELGYAPLPQGVAASAKRIVAQMR